MQVQLIMGKSLFKNVRESFKNDSELTSAQMAQSPPVEED